MRTQNDVDLNFAMPSSALHAVRSQTLNELVPRDELVAMLLIDVDNYELEILRG